MKTLLRSELNSLLQVKGACISVYVPLDPIGHEGLGDRLRLDRALNKAEQQLLVRGYTKPAVTDLSTPAHRLHESSEWAARGRGLAVLLGPGVQHILPIEAELEEEAWGDDHFHVRPLIPMVLDSDRFHVLSLSEHHVQLYEGDSNELRPMASPQLPKNVDDAVQAEQGERVFRAHMSMTGAGGAQSGAMHGQGGKPDVSKTNTAEYVAQIAELVDKALQGSSAPLVLATVRELAAVWSSASSYRHTVSEIVRGNPDYETPGELHRAAWPLAAQALRAPQAQRYQTLRDLRGTPRTASGLDKVLPAATLGRIDTLFVDTRHPVFGRFDAASGRVQIDGELGAGRCDLLELAIAQTLGSRGNVIPLQTAAEAAGEAAPEIAEAILRF